MSLEASDLVLPDFVWVVVLVIEWDYLFSVTYNYGYLPLPFIWGNFMVILHVFMIINHPKFLPNYYPKFPFWVIYPFYDFIRSFILIHFSLTLTDGKIEYGNFLIILESCF